MELALAALASLFRMEPRRICEVLIESIAHDPSADPFARCPGRNDVVTTIDALQTVSVSKLAGKGSLSKRAE